MAEAVRVTCEAAVNLPLSSLKSFQGDIKRISDENLEKLKRRILKDGVNAPLFIWKKGKTTYLLDGHQRLKALRELKKEGHEIPALPCAIIEAKNAEDAREKLLAISSQYGEFVATELRGFVESFSPDLAVLDDLRLVDFDILLTEVDTLENYTHKYEPPDNKQLRCPKCGHVDESTRFSRV